MREEPEIGDTVMASFGITGRIVSFASRPWGRVAIVDVGTMYPRVIPLESLTLIARD